MSNVSLHTLHDPAKVWSTQFDQPRVFADNVSRPIVHHLITSPFADRGEANGKKTIYRICYIIKLKVKTAYILSLIEK